MDDIKHILLVFELLNHVLILDKTNQIVYRGDDIEAALFRSRKDIQTDFLSNFSGKTEKQKWQQAILDVRTHKRPHTMNMSRQKTPFFLFPVNLNQTQNVIVSTREKILQTSQIALDLNERVKELQCLYTISSELEKSDCIDDVLPRLQQPLINGFQFPELTAVEIEVDRFSCTSKDQNLEIPASQTLHQVIATNGKSRGFLRVFYLEPETFLGEERELLKEIAVMIAKWLERLDLRIELQRHLGKLEELVREKTFAFEESQKRYQDLFENAPDGITLTALDGTILRANKAFYRTTGHPQGSILHYLKDRLLKDAEKVWADLVEGLESNGEVGGIELELLDQSGNANPVIGSFRLFKEKEQTYFKAIYKDIRFKKKLERSLIERKENLERLVGERTKDLEKQKKVLMLKTEKLLELTNACSRSRKQLESLFNAIPDTIVMIDSSHNILMSNKEEIGATGKCHQKIFSLDHPCENCPATVSFNENRAVSQERVVGSQSFLLNDYPILDSKGRVENVLEICRNTTKEKQLEFQLLQSYKLASLGKLVTGVAHEINNPNTFIRGNIKIVREAFDDIMPILDNQHSLDPALKVARLDYSVFRENVPVLLEDMVEGTSRIKKIVDGLRNYAKKDEGTLNDEVNLNQVITTSYRLVENQIRRTAKVKLTLDSDLPVFKGNIQKLEQVMVNMLLNATQAVENGRGQILVETGWDRNTDGVYVRIQDNGRGIEEKDKKYIFDPFFTTKRDTGGTGLGLSITYGIIKEHNGCIDLVSELGHGTTFTITFPLTSGDHS